MQNRFRSLTPICLALLAALPTLARAQSEDSTKDKTLEEVKVIDFRGTQMDSTKYTRDLLDTPRIITILNSDLLEEQNITSLKDAMRNLPGISLQAGEGNPPGGDQLKIRGFNARDDINVNDTRDLGNYFRDPFYVEQLEVVKGPNSAFSGRGSAGGTINFVTKKPHLKEASRIEISLGTDKYFRTTVDMNRPIDDNSAARVNLMKHQSDIPGRDITNEDRYGLYGAYTWGFKGKTRFTLDYLHTRQDDVPDAGLPMDRRNDLGNGGVVPQGLSFSNFYGHTDDYKKVDVDQIGLAFQHTFSNDMVLKNQTRYSVVRNDSVTSSPRISIGNIVGEPNDGITTTCSITVPCARGETKPRDQKDIGFNNQTDLLFNFRTGSVEHDLVTGIEFARYSYENRRRRDTRGPWTSLYNPTRRSVGSFNDAGTLYGVPKYDGTIYRFETDEIGLYVLDTMKLSPKWELNVGLRWDKVEAKATRRGFNEMNAPITNNTAHERKDDELSYSLGLLYKLQAKTSLYASYGTSFNISGNFDRNSVQLAGGGASENIVGAGFGTPPEQMTAYEAGVKWEVGAGLDVNAAIFRTETKEGRFPGQDPANITTPNVQYRIDGFELLAAGKLTNKWRLYSGYTFLISKITDAPPTSSALDRDYVLSQTLGGTPKHSFNVFSTYDATAKVTLGGGLQYVAKQTSGVDPLPTGNVTVTIPAYTVADLYATYKFTPKTQLRLNLYNAFDKKYISQLAEGGAQGIPGKGRQLIATLRHDF